MVYDSRWEGVMERIESLWSEGLTVAVERDGDRKEKTLWLGEKIFTDGRLFYWLKYLSEEERSFKLLKCIEEMLDRVELVWREVKDLIDVVGEGDRIDVGLGMVVEADVNNHGEKVVELKRNDYVLMIACAKDGKARVVYDRSVVEAIPVIVSMVRANMLLG